jgi:hypothetical protein
VVLWPVAVCPFKSLLVKVFDAATAVGRWGRLAGPAAPLGLVTTAEVDWRSKPRQGGHLAPLRQQFSRKAVPRRSPESLGNIPNYFSSIVDGQGNITHIDRKSGHPARPSLTNLDNSMTGNMVEATYEYTKGERYRLASTKKPQGVPRQPAQRSAGFWHARSLKGQK